MGRDPDPVFAPVRSQTAFEETLERLGTAIKLGLLEPGARLPPERDLCAQLGISRSTLRQALTALVQSGHLRAVRGRRGGTFVAERPPPAPAPSAQLLTSWRDVCDMRLAAELGVAVDVRQGTRMPWHPGRCAVFSVGDAELGHAGELHPRVCAEFGLPERSAAVEIDLDLLMARATVVAPGPAFSSFPLAKEDVALVVADDVAASTVEAALREGAGELLESVRLFDVYTGEQIGDGQKSLAFALRFRAPDRTLTEAETSAARDAAVARAAEVVGAVQR